MSPDELAFAVTIAICPRPFIVDSLLLANLGAIQLEASEEDDTQGDGNRSPYDLCPVEGNSQSFPERITLLLRLLLAL